MRSRDEGDEDVEEEVEVETPGLASRLASAASSVASTVKSTLSSTALMLGGGLAKGAGKASDAYVRGKDKLRTIGLPAPTETQLREYTVAIRDVLDNMRVNDGIKGQVMAKVRTAMTVQELERTRSVLDVFQRNGLSGESADQFFLGGHFMIRDGGRLFDELAALEGAEDRFSSHFASTREREQGISAGRILPEVLFIRSGEREGTGIRPREYSHFQLEASPWRAVPGGGLKNLLPTRQTLQNMEHLYDSAIYFAAKKVSERRGEAIFNRSNYGWSPYADGNPIVRMDAVPAPRVEPAERLEELLDVLVITDPEFDVDEDHEVVAGFGVGAAPR